jgi:hypothetical protein
MLTYMLPSQAVGDVTHDQLRLLNNEARQGPFSGTPSLDSYIGQRIGLRNLIHEDQNEDEAKTENT